MKKTILTTAAILLLVSIGSAEERGEVSKAFRGWTETIDRVIDVGTGGTLVLNVDDGGLEIESWDKKGVRVIIKKSADVFTEDEARKVLESFRVEITQDGNDVNISAKPQRDRRSRSLDLEIRILVPRPYSVNVETGGGGIEIGDLEGHVTARSGGGGVEIGDITNGSVDVQTGGGGISIESITNGDGRAVTGGGGINVGDVSGNLEVETGGGGIDVDNVGGELTISTGGGGLSISSGALSVTAETGGGGISIDGSRGPVEAKTGGGGISIEGAEGPVKARTGGGGIDVDGSGGPVVVSTGGGGITIDDARGYIEAKTGGGGIEATLLVDDPDVDTHCDLNSGGGDITIYLPAGLKATIDAEVRLRRRRRTHTIESDFPLQIDGDPDRSDELTAHGSINGGGDLIRLRTTNGNIRIKQL
ncbi:MAG: hypothetical protein HOM68_29580 [Gemmatimonadetes bacterium]|nr:hypothetical protein [Gemmatimonadota bacterium]MBT4608979.1 hypothetical protein [Gemmatimonadota bacterium]MBT5060733.1 hypothetical protein [Gemmatimonadota bacterium]MBT5145358.1 hypothetical protein [Gemmatimonadota bacterium]MBT5591546.1 hypothetical protein [Gemmatimonadota bacterium]